MTFTRFLSRRSVCESPLTHNQSVQSRVFVLVGHSIGKRDSIAIQQSIELDKVKLGGLIGGDGSHLLEHQLGLFIVSAGYRHIGAELGEVDSNCELASTQSAGADAPGTDSLRPACDEDILPSEVVLQVFCVQTTKATHRPTRRVCRTDGIRTAGHQIYVLVRNRGTDIIVTTRKQSTAYLPCPALVP